MITIALSATINATRSRVWKALTVLDERAAWDDRVLGIVDSGTRRLETRHAGPLAEDPALARPFRATIRWRYRLGGIPLVMQEEIRAANPPRRLLCRLSIGSLRLEQDFTLEVDEDASHARTRLGMKVMASNSIALVDEVMARLDVQKLVIAFADTTLRQIQEHCETDPGEH